MSAIGTVFASSTDLGSSVCVNPAAAAQVVNTIAMTLKNDFVISESH
jgi:hypothetical protein